MAQAAAVKRQKRPARARHAHGRPRQQVRATSSVVALPRQGIEGIGALGRRAWSIPDTRVIGLISRGRNWIVVVAALLFGLVALNVSLLQLNSSISSMAQQGQELVKKNARLRTEVAMLAAPERIIEAARQGGMVEVQPGTVKYLKRYPQPTYEQRAGAYRSLHILGD